MTTNQHSPVWVVTGASSGIGAELVVQLARRGAVVVGCARRAEQLAEVRGRALAAAPSATVEVVPLDVTDREDVRGLIARVEANHGRIDVLVVNAGIGENTVVEEFDDVEAARILDVNLRATVFAIGAVLPGMVARRGGQIVGVSSIAAYRGMPGAAVYCASKAGFSTLLEGLRVDLRRHRVGVTTVSPGFVRTPMTDRNNHSMPWLLEVEDAARRILRGVDRRHREIRFPWQLATVARLVRAMPAWIYEFFASRYSRPRSRSSDSTGA